MTSRRGAVRDEARVARFVERFGALFESGGMARIPARVFARLLVDEDGRMTAQEIGAALEVSPAAVSHATAYLNQLGLTHRERERGSRRDVHVLGDDAWHGALLTKDQVLVAAIATLRDGLEAIGGPTAAGGERLWLTLKMFEFLDEEMRDITARWEQRKAELLSGVPEH